MDFRILGPLEVVDGERPIVLRKGTECALLAYLVLHANEVVPSERLIDELWGERLQGEARVYQQLQQRQQGTTALGLEAWGKRLQAEAGVYRQLQRGQEQGPTALGLEAWGKRLQAEARVYRQLSRR